MADADKTLITRAQITSITTPATGRKALVLDGATIELGDTGIRDVSGLFIAGTVASGRLLFRRTGNLVTIILVALKTAQTATNLKIIDVGGVGFRPPYSKAEAYIEGGTTQQSRITAAGNGIYVQLANSAFTYTAMLEFVTSDAWPTTLPGVADGQPIGV